MEKEGPSPEEIARAKVESLNVLLRGITVIVAELRLKANKVVHRMDDGFAPTQDMLDALGPVINDAQQVSDALEEVDTSLLGACSEMDREFVFHSETSDRRILELLQPILAKGAPINIRFVMHYHCFFPIVHSNWDLYPFDPEWFGMNKDGRSAKGFRIQISSQEELDAFLQSRSLLPINDERFIVTPPPASE
jgi:hypothetical protein